MQRVALARARIRDPTVLILDEVTSSLDQINRSLVMDAIREWRRGKTTIIVTHDISQIEDEDLVYVMEDGSLVQQGLRWELADLPAGPFATMAALASTESRPPTPTDDEQVTDMMSLGNRSTSTIAELPQRTSFIPPSMPKELDSNRVDQGWRRLSILGSGTAVALQLRKEQIWESSDCKERPKTAGRIASYCATEKRQSSYSFDERFAPSRRCSAPEAGSISSSGGDYKVDLFSDSGYITDDQFYLFGKADRRDGIPALRLASKGELPPTMGKDGIAHHTSEKQGTLWSTLGTVWPMLTPSGRATLVFGLVMCLISAAATPMFTYCLSKLLGVLWVPVNRVAEARKWALYLMITGVIDGASTGCGHYMLERVGQSWVIGLRLEALKRILRQPKSWFDEEKNSASRINECLDRSSEETRNIVGRFIPIIVIAAGMIMVSFTWALVTSWKLTLVALSPMPVIVGAVKGYAVISRKWETKCNQGAADAGAILNETFVNIRVVRALTLEKYFGSKYQKVVSHTLGLGMRRASYTCGLFGLYQSMNFPMTALVFYYATVLISQGNGVTAAQVLHVINLLLFSVGTSTNALSSIPQMTMAQATATQLLAYATMPVESGEESQGGGLEISTPLPIEIRNLQFAYSNAPNSHILRGVSFDITRGSCTAIVGSSGSGKSTIISLLMGLYRPSEEEEGEGDVPFITYAGVPFSKIDTQQLRSTMAYVSQTPYLFPASIFDNIVYSLPQDSPARNSLNVFAAAQAAGIHDFVASLPQGYATIIGDGGIALSGGQAQRLSIARALVRQPRLLVLDEPTSALDAECSGMIRETIEGLVRRAKGQLGDMAIVMVTHTPDMMQVCDNIVVIDGGVKVEEGSYEELMRARGPFRHLVSKGEWHGGD